MFNRKVNIFCALCLIHKSPHTIIMKKNLLLITIVLISNLAEAQFIEEKSINIQIGYGLSAPNNSVDKIVNDGFFAQGELVFKNCFLD